MALADNDLIEVVVNMFAQNMQMLNVFQYEITDHIGTVSLVQLLEGYWNHVKATYRAIVPSSYGNIFVSIKGRELNDASGDYAEFDVPVGERAGTRSTSGEALPPFGAAGVRLVVGTRVTKPGQKRFPFVLEADQVSGVLGTTYTTPLIALMNVLSVPMVLGAPAALETLQPIVTRRGALGFVSSFQPVTGYLINPNVTTQNTRKFGRGS